MDTTPRSAGTGSSSGSLAGACALLVLVLPVLVVASRLGVGGPVVLLVPVVLAGVVLARGWRPLCSTRAVAVGHAVALLVGAVLLGALTAYLVATAAGLSDSSSVDHQIGGVLAGGAVALFAPSVWLAVLGRWDRRILVARAAAGL
jgi:hypothetical protein